MSKGFRRSVPLFVLTAALAVSLLACAGAGAPSPVTTSESRPLKVCLYWGFAPFASAPSQSSPTSKWEGWDVDYLKDFATANGRGFEVVPMDFKDIWLQPGKGLCDIAGTGISDTEDRREATKKAGGAAWSNTYYHVLRAFLVRKGDHIIQVEDLRGTKAIVTQGSTANIDLCYRMNQKGIHPCVKTDGDHPCSSFPGLSLSEFPETARETDPTCVYIDYPRDKDETCAGADVAAGTNKYPGPFTYGGGYGSIQSLADGSSKGKCTISKKAPLDPDPAWAHCNMVDKDYNAWAEPFSFVVRSADAGLLKALNCYINSHKYPGTPIPDSPACTAPPWTPAPDKDCPQ